MIQTIDLDTRSVDFLQFYAHFDLDDVACLQNRGSNLLVQFSNNGRATWTLLKELYTMDYTSTRLE